MKILVTGGGGFLGSAIVRQLVERKHEVRMINRKAYSELVGLGVRGYEGDIADQELVERAVDGCEVVFHVAAKAGVWGPEREYFSANVLGTRHVLQACQNQGVKALVYTSTPSVVFAGESIKGGDESLPYPENYLCAYPKTKAQAEREVLEADGREGVRTVALRPHLLWGPNDPHLIPRILDRVELGRLRQVGEGTNQVDITYIDNGAQAHLCAMDRLLETPDRVGGKPYFISQGEPVNLWAWIRRLLEGFDLKLPEHYLSYRTAYRAGAILEAVHKVFARKVEPMMTRFVAQQLVQDHYFSHRAAREELGFVPEVSVDEGLKRVWAFDWKRD